MKSDWTNRTRNAVALVPMSRDAVYQLCSKYLSTIVERLPHTRLFIDSIKATTADGGKGELWKVEIRFIRVPWYFLKIYGRPKNINEMPIP